MEVACETQTPPSCNTDMKSFKAYLTRWMAATTKMAPFTYDTIQKALLVSAKAAAAQCTGGDKGRACGLKWVTNGKTGTWDGTTGVGEQMGALEVIQSTLVAQTAGPVTNKTGGTSTGDPTAGSGSARTAADLRDSWVPTTGDRAGAGILTAVVLVGVLGGIGWVSMD
jgi:mannan endo-1,6-alpha-mannosidase